MIPLWMHFLADHMQGNSKQDYDLRRVTESFFAYPDTTRAITLFFYETIASKADSTSADYLQPLKQASISQHVHLEIRNRWLLALEETLAELETSCLLLKGSALDGYAYPLGSRCGADVDLLLRHDDVAPVSQHLGDKGLLAEHRHSFDFEETWVAHAAAPFEVDIHRQLTIPICYAIDYEGLWERSLASPLSKTGFLRIPSAEDQLLITSMNSARDLAYFQHRLIDSLALLSLTDLDTQRLLDIATDWNITPLLYAQLCAAQMLSPDHTPPEAIPFQMNTVRRTLIRQFVVSTLSGEPSGARRRVKQVWSQWLLCKPSHAALKYQARFLLNKVRQ